MIVRIHNIPLYIIFKCLRQYHIFFIKYIFYVKNFFSTKFRPHWNPGENNHQNVKCKSLCSLLKATEDYPYHIDIIAWSKVLAQLQLIKMQSIIWGWSLCAVWNLSYTGRTCFFMAIYSCMHECWKNLFFFHFPSHNKRHMTHTSFCKRETNACSHFSLWN